MIKIYILGVNHEYLFMSSVYFIFVLILIFSFQWINGQGIPVEIIYDIPGESSNVNGSCIGNENYCCNSAAIKTGNYSDDGHEQFANNSRSSVTDIFWGPVLIILSLLVLRAFSKRVEE